MNRLTLYNLYRFLSAYTLTGSGWKCNATGVLWVTERRALENFNR